MVLTGHLFIKGHETENVGIPLQSCSFGFNQEIDERGLPKSVVKGGVIKLSFQSIDDGEIMHWMLSTHADKSGKITFSGEEGQKVFKTIEFKDARCVSYNETFIRDGEMIQEISISTREITVSGATHANTWTKYEGT